MVFHLLVRWSCNCYESGGWLCIKKWAGKRLQEWWCFPASYNMVSAVWLFYQIVSRLVCGLVALLCTVHYQWQVLWEKLPFGALTILCSKRLIECSTHGPMKFSGSPFSTATAQIRRFPGWITQLVPAGAPSRPASHGHICHISIALLFSAGEFPGCRHWWWRLGTANTSAPIGQILALNSPCYTSLHTVNMIKDTEGYHIFTIDSEYT